MEYLLYVAVKLVSYSAWCWVGLRWLRPSASLRAAFGYGLLRLFVGVVFGAFIFFAYQPSPENLALKYVAIYAPVRLVEWAIMVAIFSIRSGPDTCSGKAALWCLGGILVSFAADLASPEGISGHFCIGRCLC
jgi:hypothetical protein